MKKIFAIIFLLLMLSACSTLPHNMDLSADIRETGNYSKAPSANSSRGSDDLLLILTFSGGGTRAASFSYGVLKELRDIRINKNGKNKNLLSEVDIISSVSGGSFTSAYYGLYGDRIFSDYETRFLKKQVQGGLINMIINPVHWPHFGNRSDLIAKYFEKNIFGKKTFRDMLNDGPLIVINATDISAGTAFSFTPINFRRICSNLEDYSVGRAVTASSAVPIVFSPLTLKNHSGCDPIPYQARKISGSISHIEEQAIGVRKYQEKNRYPYLHLVDGGVADNLGILSLLRVVLELDNNFWEAMKTYDFTETHKIAFIIVNAADSLAPSIAMAPTPPSVFGTMNAVSTIQLKRSNTEMLDLLAHQFQKWEAQVQRERCQETQKPDCNEIRFYLAELNFKQLPLDQAEALSLIETSLELSPDKVDMLVEAGRCALRASPQVKQLLTDLQVEDNI